MKLNSPSFINFKHVTPALIILIYDFIDREMTIKTILDIKENEFINDDELEDFGALKNIASVVHLDDTQQRIASHANVRRVTSAVNDEIALKARKNFSAEGQRL